MLGVSTGLVRSTATTGNNSFPECHFAATSAGRRVTVIVNVDSSPQPYFRLERTIVEDGQQFGVQRNFSPPQTVSHLGLDAAWVPDQRLLLTTDGKALISVTIGWRGAGPGRRVALAKAAAQAYLGKPQPKNATGYSSA